MSRRVPLHLLGGLLLLLALVGGGAAARAQPSEHAVKAAFIPKFARYVEWPGPPGRSAWTLCLIGRDPFGALIDQAAAQERIDGRPIQVRRLPDLAGSQACQLAFVRGATPEETARWLMALRDQPILTITDHRGGPHRGIIHFTVAGGRVRFFIDDAAAAQRRLSISSRLLALALGVRQRRQ